MVDAAERTHVSRRFAVARAWRILGVSRTARFSRIPRLRARGPVVRSHQAEAPVCECGAKDQVSRAGAPNRTSGKGRHGARETGRSACSRSRWVSAVALASAWLQQARSRSSSSRRWRRPLSARPGRCAPASTWTTRRSAAPTTASRRASTSTSRRRSPSGSGSSSSSSRSSRRTPRPSSRAARSTSCCRFRSRPRRSRTSRSPAPTRPTRPAFFVATEDTAPIEPTMTIETLPAAPAKVGVQKGSEAYWKLSYDLGPEAVQVVPDAARRDRGACERRGPRRGGRRARRRLHRSRLSQRALRGTDGAGDPLGVAVTPENTNSRTRRARRSTALLPTACSTRFAASGSATSPSSRSRPASAASETSDAATP